MTEERNVQMLNTLVLMATVVLLLSARAHAAAPIPLDPDRVAEIAPLLYDHTTALGKPIQAKEHWRRLKGHAAFKDVIPQAKKLLDEPIPEKTRELFMDFFETGTRRNWEQVDRVWRNRLSTFFLAECLDNQGRFIPALEEVILLFCEEPTWMMPAHQPALEAYRGQTMDIDLKAADVGHTFALIDYIAGERISPEVRARLRAEVTRRIFVPYREMITGERPHSWWLMTTNNWNAVCIAGVTGAALALIEDRDERALYVAAAETYTTRFLAGFTPDGYCSEGVGYWGYGYGHYLLLCELVHQATQGQVDLLKRDGAQAAARYAAVVEIQNGIYPPFADCSVNARPSPEFLYYVNRRLGLGFTEYDHVDTIGPKSHLASTLMYSFPTSADVATPTVSPEPRLGARTWFPDAGVLICRPGDGAARMAIAMKGGHNAEHHNHNDVGSYLVVVGGEAVLVDPGAEVYTQRTFSSRRYESNVLNSFGHPVPKVAGKLQRSGRDARGEVVETDFGAEADQLVLDLTSAYDVPSLKQLGRSFRYVRAGAGMLAVTDEVQFDSPEAFETALVTLGSWTRIDANTLVFHELDEGVRVRLEVQGGPFDVSAEEIDEDVRTATKPTRVAIRMTEPVETATIRMMITPELGDENAPLLMNGGFEEGTVGWQLGDQGISSIERGLSASGEAALRIDDTSETHGSNVRSRRVDATPNSEYSVSGKHYPVDGSGLGIYVLFYDRAGAFLNEHDGRMNFAALGILDGDAKHWQPFEYRFKTPPDTDHLRVWVHSMNAAKVTAFLDDITVSPR